MLQVVLNLHLTLAEVAIPCRFWPCSARIYAQDHPLQTLYMYWKIFSEQSICLLFRRRSRSSSRSRTPPRRDRGRRRSHSDSSRSVSIDYSDHNLWQIVFLKLSRKPKQNLFWGSGVGEKKCMLGQTFLLVDSEHARWIRKWSFSLKSLLPVSCSLDEVEPQAYIHSIKNWKLQT